jgi:hypothetical protein
MIYFIIITLRRAFVSSIGFWYTLIIIIAAGTLFCGVRYYVLWYAACSMPHVALWHDRDIYHDI